MSYLISPTELKKLKLQSGSKLIILDATLPKVKVKKNPDFTGCIPNALEFDLVNIFNDKTAQFPNTCLQPSDLISKLKKLGINNNSKVIIYDRHGIYSSPRAWWLLKQLGHQNVFVLNGGLPGWIKDGGSIENSYATSHLIGDFSKSNTKTPLQTNKDLLKQLDNPHQLTIDARSNKRFLGLEPEPRVGLRAGHIPNSKNLHYSSLVKGYNLINKPDIQTLFNELGYHKKTITYTCGSGITACILALAGTEIGIDQFSIYDGSWTEWGSLKELPIEK